MNISPGTLVALHPPSILGWPITIGVVTNILGSHHADDFLVMWSDGDLAYYNKTHANKRH